MKKLMTLMVALLCVMVASCGGNGVDPTVVAQKIEKGQSLTQADYASMINYCGDYAQKAQKYFDIINAEPNDSTSEAIKASDELAGMYADAKYLDIFRKALTDADEAQLGEANTKKIAEYSKYEAFPIADVSDSTMLNPDIVGDIEDMPAKDTAGVIATGDGEVVEANK